MTLSDAVVVVAALAGQPGARALDPSDIQQSTLRAVYRATLAVPDGPDGPDLALVASSLPPVLDQRPALSYLRTLLDSVPAVADLAPHLAAVRDAAARRRVASRLAADSVAVASADDLDAFLNDHTDALRALTARASADRRIPGVTGAELAQPVPPVPWLVPAAQLAPGRPAILAAYGGSGKTWLACDLALAISGRGDVLGGAWGVARRGAVLHLNYEMSHPSLIDRYQRLARGRGQDIASAQLHVSSRHHLGPLALTDADFPLRLGDTIRSAGAVLVIIDSLRAAMPGIDENSSDARRYLDVILGVSDATGATVLVIHHEGKPPTQGSRDTVLRLRGSSALVDACDTTWHLRALGEDSGGGLVVEPGKSSRGGRAESVRARLVDGEGGAIRWDYEAPEQRVDEIDRTDRDCEDSILAALGTHGTLTYSAIVDGSKSGVRGKGARRKACLRRLAADGVVVESRQGHKRLWSLAL